MTIGIILIVVAALAVLTIGYFAKWSPKQRARKRLAAERENAADRHREVASERHSHASVAEQKAEEARVQAQRAEQEAELARTEASVHEGRAGLHDQGLADDELDSGSREHRPENIDRAGPDEETTQMDRPANLADREGGRFSRDGEWIGDSERDQRRETPAQRW